MTSRLYAASHDGFGPLVCAAGIVADEGILEGAESAVIRVKDEGSGQAALPEVRLGLLIIGADGVGIGVLSEGSKGVPRHCSRQVF